MKKNIEVFDFKEEDELPEFTARKWVEKFRNPNPGDSLILEHQYIRNFYQGNGIQKEELGNASCVDADVETDNSREGSPTFMAEAEGSRPGPACQLNLKAHEGETGVDQVNHGSGSFSFKAGSKNFFEASSPNRCQLKSSLSDSPSSQEKVDMMSANDESFSDHSTLSPASNSAGDSDLLKDWQAELCFDVGEKIDINTAVIMSPDYVVLQDGPCTAAVVIFSCNGVIIKGYFANDEEGSFSYEWRVEDIVNIRYRWLQNVGLVIMKVHVLLKNEKYIEDMQSTSDVEELKFVVAEHSWPEKQQKINSLNVKYPAVWSAELDGHMEVTADNLSQESRYFPSFDEPFEDVIYPKGDPDAVSICKRDVDLLQPETFVNDTIIDFYINYLKNQIQPEEKHRFHFFNSFFFRKLADLDKDPSSIADGKAAFLRVRKWTRKVDIFGKDYILIPVNFNLHWSLIVICHPGEVADYTDVDLNESVRVPCILHMDSIRGSHAGLKNLVQGYLCEEWKERHKETSDDISSKFLNLRFVSLELPQQENSFDCGLFLLHYLELFLAEAPHDFNPFKISKGSNFLYADWFPPAEASLKRTLIQKLIFELLENRSQEVSSEKNQSSESPLKNEKGSGTEVLSGRRSSYATCHRNLPESQDTQGIEMTLLERSSLKNLHGVNDTVIVLRELFDPGVTSGSLLGQLQHLEEPSPFYHLNNDISSREQVDAESREQFMCLTSGESNFQRITEMAAPRVSTPFSHGGFGAEMSWNLGISVHTEHEVDASSSESASDDSDEIGIIEPDSVGKARINHDKETGESPVRNMVSSSTPPPEAVSTVTILNADLENNNYDKEPCPLKDNPLVPTGEDVRADKTQLADDVGMVVNMSIKEEPYPPEDNPVVPTGQDVGADKTQLSDGMGMVETTSDKEGPCPPEDNPVLLTGQDVGADKTQLSDGVRMVETASDKEGPCPPEDNPVLPTGQDVRADKTQLADDVGMVETTSDKEEPCPMEDKPVAPTGQDVKADKTQTADDIEMVEKTSDKEEPCPPGDNPVVPTGQDVRADKTQMADDVGMVESTCDKEEPCPQEDNPVAPTGPDVRADKTQLADDIEMAENTNENVSNVGDCGPLVEAHEEEEEQAAKRRRLSPREEI